MVWYRNHIDIILLFSFITMTGCATHRTSAITPEARTLGKNFKSFKALESVSAEETESQSLLEQRDKITLGQALSLALLNNPELAMFSCEIQAAEKRAIQAGLYPNPEFEVELENVGGSGELRGFNVTETTLFISQPFLLAGKRYKAMQSAALEGDLAAWDYESKRLDVITQVRQAFTRLLASQQSVKLKEEMVTLSERLVVSIRERVDAGKVSPAELSRAQVSLSATQVGLNRAQRERETNRLQLAAIWGSQTVKFNEAVGTLDSLIAIPALHKLKPYLYLNPDLARYEKELEQRESVIALEDARRIPDPVLSGGIRRINESDDHSFVLALSVPLPLTDRNQGARQEARIELTKALWEKEAVEVQLNTALIKSYNQLQSVYNEATTLRDHIVLEAQKSFDIIQEGYLMGRFDFLDVLDAQRTLFEVKEQSVEAFTEYHQTVAEIERLITQGIGTIP